jgi:hypothetical protein
VSIHPLHRRPSRPTIEEDLADIRRDLEDLAATAHEQRAALVQLESHVAAVKAGTNEILSILRGDTR